MGVGLSPGKNNLNMKALRMAGFHSSIIAWLVLAAGGAIAASDFESNLEKTFHVSPGGKFTLEADQGSCKVSPVEGNEVRVRVLRKIEGASKAQADEIFTNQQVTFQQNGGTVSVEAKNKKNLSMWRQQPYLQVRYEINIPKTFNVDLRTSGGDIQVGDLEGWVKARTSSGTIDLGRAAGDVDAGNSGGNIVVAEAGGSVKGTTSSGSIRVGKALRKAELSNSGGDIQIGEGGEAVEVKTSSGSIKVQRAKGQLKAANSGGDIFVGTAEGDVTAETSSGAIQLDRVQGARVEVRNSGGDIGIEHASGTVVARTSSGSIKIKKVDGYVTARNSGGEIFLEEVDGKTEAETSSGSIRIQLGKGEIKARNSGGDIKIGEAGGQVFAQTSSGSIVVKLAKGKVDAKNSGGDIKVEEARTAVQAGTSSGKINVSFAAQPSEDCHLGVSGGGVTVTLGKSVAVNLDAEARGGRIKTEIPITVNGEQKRDALQGKVNGGGPNLILRSSSGDIEIKAGTGTVATLEDESPGK
jgi:DUF4097 and DUF4098 domain-containing protein YvlB